MRLILHNYNSGLPKIVKGSITLDLYLLKLENLKFTWIMKKEATMTKKKQTKITNMALWDIKTHCICNIETSCLSRNEFCFF